MQLQEFERPEAISTSISNSRNPEVSSDIGLQNSPALQTQIIPPDNLKVVTLTAVNEDEEKQNDKKNALSISGSWFIDGYGRKVLLRGVNVSGNAKLPYTPYLPSHISSQFFDDINVSFVNRPFPLSQADEHFSRLKSWGFNFFRFCITWEAIEHYGPGIYDMEFINYVIAVLRKAKAYGLKCFIDPHQDVWSRFCGGSGAPNWTLKLVGLDATKFGPTNAAIVHNTWAESGLPWTTTNPKDYPKMIWQTNYFKLACATMFTLFFGGKLYTPDFIITDEYQEKPSISSSTSNFSTGQYNIEDYLQSHFINSFKTLAREIHKDGSLEDTVVLGYDTLNEPGPGYIGISDLSVIPVSQELKQGLTPTPIQTMLLGTGATCDVANWKVTSVGPVPWGSYTVNSEKEVAWLLKRVTPKEFEDFVQYESPNPPQTSFPQGCIWKAMGLYDVNSQELLQPNYFGCNPSTGAAMTMHDFQDTLWLPFSQRFLMEIRTIHQTAMVFLEPPVNEEPPNLRNVQIYAPHWYDGLTLITKHWGFYNMDYLLVKRKLKTMLTALRFGTHGVRECMRVQLELIKHECEEFIGSAAPTILGEIGIPYDMDDKYAYYMGDFSSQIQALDCNLRAIESNLLNVTLWNYCPDNSYEWGDGWNGEDLSLYSL
ncbi:glycoside hydrolase superfamily, partial [Paraphysoderma sedebokerense]